MEGSVEGSRRAGWVREREKQRGCAVVWRRTKMHSRRRKKRRGSGACCTAVDVVEGAWMRLGVATGGRVTRRAHVGTDDGPSAEPILAVPLDQLVVLEYPFHQHELPAYQSRVVRRAKALTGGLGVAAFAGSRTTHVLKLGLRDPARINHPSVLHIGHGPVLVGLALVPRNPASPIRHPITTRQVPCSHQDFSKGFVGILHNLQGRISDLHVNPAIRHFAFWIATSHARFPILLGRPAVARAQVLPGDLRNPPLRLVSLHFHVQTLLQMQTHASIRPRVHFDAHVLARRKARASSPRSNHRLGGSRTPRTRTAIGRPVPRGPVGLEFGFEREVL